MTKKEIAEKVAAVANISKAQATLAIDAALIEIRNAVGNNEEVFFRHFGTFKKVHRGEKVARNIKTGEKVVVPAHDVPFFKPSKSF